jgi:hypothetical protein
VGFSNVRYPELFARINARFGMKWLSGPRYTSLTKKLGIVEMVLAALSMFVFLIMVALGLSRF